LKTEIEKYTTKTNWSLQTDFHFGGYAKYNATLIRFINDFNEETKVLLDPIYTAKMIYGLLQIIKNDGFKKGSKILAIHTGGLQGIQGVNQKLHKNNEQIIH
jgi:1-aminocyclopropane-1-carboxylate deaminase